MPSLFISDLHLYRGRPESAALFHHFLTTWLSAGDRLYILGDLFEVWLGDDAIGVHERKIIDLLAATRARGVEIGFMRGNRDFLVGDDFATLSGCVLLDDPTVVSLDGEQVLLMHGDVLCTDDTDYQDYRRTVRADPFVKDFLSQPIAARQAIASRYREISQQATSAKPPDIMDVNQGAVETIMQRYAVGRLIHGHTHRPAVHEFHIDGRQAWRMVLGDWFQRGSVLIHDHGAYHLKTIEPPPRN